MLSGYIDGYANCKFGVITGDLKATGASSMSYTSGTFAGDAAGKLLLVAGNHDCYDSWDGNQSNKVSRHMTDWMYDVMGDDVNWGDTNGTDNEPLLSSYWYKDFNVDSDYPVRVISLDQYEIDKAYGTDRYKDFTNGFWYNPVYSAAQMNWLINLLLNTTSNYNIIVLCHQSPYTDNEYFTQSLKVTSENDSYNNVPYSKLFISEKCGNAPFTESGYYNYNNFLLKIIRAYLNSSTYSENLLIGKMTPGTEDLRITINADFTNTTPARFWGWYYGHLHLDLVCWAPYEQFKEGETKELFPNQLMVGVTCVNKRTGGNCDLVKDIVYRINKYTLDFEKGELLIERIGQQLTTGGRTRDRLLFNMEDMSISHPIN